MLPTGDINYVKKQMRWQSSLALNSAAIMASVDGFVQTNKKKNVRSSRLELEYTLQPQRRGAKAERFTFNNKLRIEPRTPQYSLDT